MKSAPVEVAIAILYQADQFLMQLRDDIPGIAYPGQWGLFGGHLEPGETPEVTMKRELIEEIGHAPNSLSVFSSYKTPSVIRHVFCSPLTVDPTDLTLNEGWDLGLLSCSDIRQGYAYSQQAGKVCPIGQPHQQILIDFMTQQRSLSHS